MYGTAPIVRIRRKVCTSLLSCTSCPRASRIGSIHHQSAKTGVNKIQRWTRQRWKCIPRSEGLPPVNAWEPRVSSPVLPPSATMKPGKIGRRIADSTEKEKAVLASYKGQHISKGRYLRNCLDQMRKYELRTVKLPRAHGVQGVR
jgi:hypothetical protein